MRRALFLLLWMAAAIASEAAVQVQQQADGKFYTAVLVNGGTTSKYDIVFIGDGFRGADQAVFNTAVDNAVAALRARPGYSEEMCGFNIWRVNVISTDEGVDHPANNIARNTELDCRYGNPAVGEAERCIVTDSPAKCLEAAAYAPGRDATFVLVNDTQFGGCAGDIVCSSIAAGFAGLITHELAHKLSELADEYDCYVCDGSDDNRTYSGSDPGEVNITNNTNRATTKWADLIAATTSIPTTSDIPGGVVGLWEGAGYFRRAMYRPQNNCHMRTLDSGFCAVCGRKVHDDLQFRCTAAFDLLKDRRFIWREKFHLPIPLCLSCPLPGENNLLDQVALRFAGLPEDARVRIIDSEGRVVAEGRSAQQNGTVAEFAANRWTLYSAEIIPGTAARSQQVALEAELTRNGQVQELPALKPR